MAHEFTMPKLGLTMTEGTIREWLVPDGSQVNVGDPVLVIETDKIETEVEARDTGTLVISGEVGRTYACGDVIGQVVGTDEAAADPGEPLGDPTAEPPAQIPVAQTPVAQAQLDLQDESEPPGDVPAQPAQGRSADTAPPSTGGAPGTADEAKPVSPWRRILDRQSSAAQTAVAEVAAQAVAAVGAELAANGRAARGEGGRILASPRARAAARTAGVELDEIVGTGPGGRILGEDVTAFAEAQAAARVRAPGDEIGPADPVVAAVSEAADDAVVAEAASAEGTSEPTVDFDDAVGATASAEPSEDAPVDDSTMIQATGGARMLAELLEIDLNDIPVPADGSRITREHVAAWVRERLAAVAAFATDDPQAEAPESPAPSPEAPSAEAPAATPLSSDPSTEHATPATPEPQSATQPTRLLQLPSSVTPLRGVRGLIAERMHNSLSEMAQLTLAVDVDMGAVNAERGRRRDDGRPVPGYTAWVIAAAARALVDHPYVNSEVTPDGIALLPQVHVGVAVALDEGLIVPVIHGAASRTVEDLHETVADLAARARDGALDYHELEGGTFSVTALGMYGVDVFTPIVNPPNTAILGIGRLRTETRWDFATPSPATVMTLSLSWDHRAFDGAPAAEFAQTIVRCLENPSSLHP